MDRSELIYLVSEKKTQDDLGQWVTEEYLRPVFCSASSVTRQEYFDAARRAEWSEAGITGFKPQYMFDIFEPDYDGELSVEYNGKRYGIYRTFRKKGERLELYVEEKGGLRYGN